jgi:D-glycero-D-manno-heptose 1,7-bisphosphate phosphatase
MGTKNRAIKLYIFDADGTLRRSTVAGQPTPNQESEWELLPKVKTKISQILSQQEDTLIGIASNQGGIELGYLSKQQARKLLNDLYKDLTGKVPPKGMIQLCPDFKKTSECRKPNPGMLQEIIKQAGVSPDQTVFIGDQEDDRLAAKNAGVAFVWARDFFRW